MVALLTFLGRALMDWRYEYSRQDPTGIWDTPLALIFMGLIWGWQWDPIGGKSWQPPGADRLSDRSPVVGEKPEVANRVEYLGGGSFTIMLQVRPHGFFQNRPLLKDSTSGETTLQTCSPFFVFTFVRPLVLVGLHLFASVTPGGETARLKS